MHCWNQAVYLEQAHPEGRYVDVYADTEKREEAYRRWMAMTHPGTLQGGLRWTEVFDRPYRPDRRIFFVEKG